MSLNPKCLVALAFVASLATALHGQQLVPQDTTEPIQTDPIQTEPIVRPASWAAAPQDDEVTDQQALAKTLDDFNRRLKDVESVTSGVRSDQADKSYSERFTTLEEGLAESLEKIGDVDDSLDSYVRSGHSGSKMKVSGRVHADHWHFASENPGIDILEGGDPQDRIGFRRLRFGVGGDVTDNMIYRIEMEFAGGNKTEFRDAYLGFKDLAYFNTVIIGNHKRPYGLDHLNSSRYNVFIERPFSIEAFNQDARRLGVSSNGVSDDQSWNWRYGVFNQELVQATGNYLGDDYQLEFAGRLAKTWWWDEATDGRGYGHFALSGSWGLPDGLGPNNQSRYRTRPEARSSNRWIDTGTIAGAESFALVGFESVVNVGPTQVVAEYQIVDVDRLAAFGPHTQFHGGYAYVSYFLTGEHIPWNRETGCLGRVKPFENFWAVCDCEGYVQRGLGAWQVAARYSYADFEDDNIFGGRGRALTLGLNWHWNSAARMQFNYIAGDIEGVPGAGGDYQIIGTRFMIDF